MSTQHPTPRPWYCPDDLIDDYKDVGRSGGDLRMLKTLKVVRAIVVNVGITAIALYALSIDGVNPTVVGGLGVATLGLYNGIEVGDYKALVRAIYELSQESQGSGRDES